MDNSAMPINWYPGHMARTKRILTEQIRKMDLIVELCDARLPYSSRNPEIEQLSAGRKKILFLNKADLANPEATAQWLRLFRKKGTDVYAIDSKTGKIVVNSSYNLNKVNTASNRLGEINLPKSTNTISANTIGGGNTI
jgi:ribosome biogenesis GTPase A